MSKATKDGNNFRREWDKEAFEKRAKERLDAELALEDEREHKKTAPAPIVQRAPLQRRTEDLQIAKYVGTRQVVTGAEALAGAGAGHCVAYVGWSGAVSSGDHLEVPLSLAQSLGLTRAGRPRHHSETEAKVTDDEAGLVVQISVMPGRPRIARRLEVEPDTCDDWEALQVAAVHLEQNIFF